MYKAPKEDPDFVKYWELFVNDVAARENFKPGHLEQLRVLCQLYIEYDKLTDQISKEGFTYETDPSGESRYGNQKKINPACQLRDKVLMEIRQFSKLLSLTVTEDKEYKDKEKINDEWD